MKRKITNILLRTPVVLLLIAGCSKEGDTENVFSDGILIEVEAPQINGWSTEEITGTRSVRTKTVEVKGKDGLDMEISIQHGTAEAAAAEGATTRWANMDDNIAFQVVAYKSATAAGISTSNYAGYGNYKLSGSSVLAVKSLLVPVGTYTFVFYSYGNSSSIAAFTNSSTSVSATNGQNFMTYVKPGVTINNTGSKYTLGGIVFKHHCARYRVQAITQAGRMGAITACSGTVTLPKHNATYTFTDGAFAIQATTGSANITWTNPDAMSVYSDYVYLLPQTSASITMKLNPTIDGRAFTGKSFTLPGITLAANNTYYSDVSFTTTLGYIVRGSFWASGNLYYDGTFNIYAEQHEFNTGRAHDFWRWGALYPTDAYADTSTWTQDPCQQVSPAKSWRLPTVAEYTSLTKGYSKQTTQNGKAGAIFDDIVFFPAAGYYPGFNTDAYSQPIRGLYWASSELRMMYYHADNVYVPAMNTSDHQDNYMTIRCVRAD